MYPKEFGKGIQDGLRQAKERRTIKSPTYKSTIMDNNNTDKEVKHTQEEEIWKIVNIEELGGKYEVSSLGNVNKLWGNGIKTKMTTHNNGTGYLTVRLTNKPFQRICTIHRLVAITFIPNPENKETVNHKNLIKTDNRLENLEWATWKENTRHFYKYGTPNNNSKKRLDILSNLGNPVLHFSKDGIFLNEYKSIAECARKTGICYTTISHICNANTKKSRKYDFRLKNIDNNKSDNDIKIKYADAIEALKEVRECIVGGSVEMWTKINNVLKNYENK